MKTNFWFTVCLVILLAIIGFTLHMTVKNEALKTSMKYLYKDAVIGRVNSSLMLGSSSIMRLDPKKYINCVTWLNRGIGASTISDIKRYITISPLSITPPEILIYAGENDISQGLSARKTIQAYKELLLLLRDKYPDSNLHVIAIKLSPSRKSNWDKFRIVNDALKTYLSHTQRSYFHSPNWDDKGYRNSNSFTDDGVHLTHYGYSVFTSGVNKLLCKTN